jgi:hypothetical protein
MTDSLSTMNVCCVYITDITENIVSVQAVSEHTEQQGAGRSPQRPCLGHTRGWDFQTELCPETSAPPRQHTSQSFLSLVFPEWADKAI